jgi:hypothetical protein
MGRKYYRKLALEQNRRQKNQQRKIQEQQVYETTESGNKEFEGDLCVFFFTTVATRERNIEILTEIYHIL